MTKGSLIGQRIGHFRIGSILGRGGMGEVYAAHDEKLDRVVALKVIKPERRLDESSKARFRQEARVLSLLQHPNICQVFDYLECDGVDVLVLELIRGRALQDVQLELSFRQKLEVARQIAVVLVAAHRKGIVHRDLKPGNVMVTSDGLVKVLDFGVSRRRSLDPRFVKPPPGHGGGDESEEDSPAIALDCDTQTVTISPAPPSPITRRGRTGDQAPATLTAEGTVLGTLSYMSPEQARGEAAAASSDIYSFGLLLQELFTGRRAYDQTRYVVDGLSLVATGDTTLVEGVDGDVAALIKRLKDPAPAVRPSAIYAQEQIEQLLDRPRRRFRVFVLIAAMLALFVFASFMTVQTVRARRAEQGARAAKEAALNAQRDAQREAVTSQRVTELLVEMFRGSDPYSPEVGGKEITVRQMLDEGVKRINNELEDEPEIRARLLDAVGRVYRNLGAYESAEPLISEALRIREAILAPDHRQIADSLIHLAWLYDQQGRYSESEPLRLRSIEIAERALGPDDPAVADGVNDLAVLYRTLGRYQDAIPLYLRSIAIREKAFGPESHQVAASLNNLAVVYRHQGRYEQAEQLYRRSLAIREAELGPDHPQVAASLNNLAVVCRYQGRYEEAEILYRKSLAIREAELGPNHPQVAASLNNLAVVYRNQARYEEAEALYERSLAIRVNALGPEHPRVADSLANLATLYRFQGRFRDSRNLIRKSLEIRIAALGPSHPLVAVSTRSLGEISGDLGEFAAAEKLFREAVEIHQRSADADGPAMGETLYSWARLEASLGRRRKAIELLERSLSAGGAKRYMRNIHADFASLRDDASFQKIESLVVARIDINDVTDGND